MIDILIYKQPRSAVQLGCQQSKWILEFIQKRPKPFDVKTGWCGMREPLQHHRLVFSSLAKAISFAEASTLSYRCC